MSGQSGDALDINWDEDVDMLRGMIYLLILIADSEDEDELDENVETIEKEDVKETKETGIKRKRDEKETKGIIYEVL